ncbi:flagellar export chaperone FliS [bacterium]|nr:flagellar export chaperone FliS [bacterium]
MAHCGYSAYQEAHAHELDQAKLILMMFAGSINYLNKVLEIAENDHSETGRLVNKTKNIILELISSLNMDESGEMGEILLRTYRGLYVKLNTAYFRNDLLSVAEVRDSLVELEDAWKKVFRSTEYQDFKKDRERFRKKYHGFKG